MNIYINIYIFWERELERGWMSFWDDAVVVVVFVVSGGGGGTLVFYQASPNNCYILYVYHTVYSLK